MSCGRTMLLAAEPGQARSCLLIGLTRILATFECGLKRPPKLTMRTPRNMARVSTTLGLPMGILACRWMRSGLAHQTGTTDPDLTRYAVR